MCFTKVTKLVSNTYVIKELFQEESNKAISLIGGGLLLVAGADDTILRGEEIDSGLLKEETKTNLALLHPKGVLFSLEH